MSNHRTCCCGDDPCSGPNRDRFVEIQPIMFPDKFMAHKDGPFAVPDPGVSFWLKYRGSCPLSDEDVIVEQETGIEIDDPDDEQKFEVRQILVGDYETKFMTDLGPQVAEQFPDPGTPGTITRPGDNQAFTWRTFSDYGGGWGSRMDSNNYLVRMIAMTMWHRNCFTIKQTTSDDTEFPFLTEDEWLARDDYRIVFLNEGTNPGEVTEPENIAQYGVHIFTDDVPFKPIDAEPNKYSPALHCIPDGVVAGFAYSFDPEPEDQAQFILYNYLDYYPNEFGLSVASGAPGSKTMRDLLEPCSVEYEVPPGDTFPGVEIVGVAEPVMHAILPMQVSQRFIVPNESWTIQLGKPYQNHREPDNGKSCNENFEDCPPNTNCFCPSSGLCHGVNTGIAQPYGFGSVGSTNALSRSPASRHVKGSPLKNRLFLQRCFRQIGNDFFPSRPSAIGVQASAEGSDDFETATFETYTGPTAESVDFYVDGYIRGGSDGEDPNPPLLAGDGEGYPIGMYRYNLINQVDVYDFECSCIPSGVINANHGRLDGYGTDFVYSPSSEWHKTTGGARETGAGFADTPGGLLYLFAHVLTDGPNPPDPETVNNGQDRKVQDPIFVFP